MREDKREKIYYGNKKTAQLYKKILLCGNRMILSSAYLLNRIVTNHDEAVTTVAFVTYRPQIRKYTC